MNELERFKLGTLCTACNLPITLGKFPKQINEKWYHAECANKIRCTGCRWRTPKSLGGDGILCFNKNGECPSWAVKWATRYQIDNRKGRPARITDEDILEAMRL